MKGFCSDDSVMFSMLQYPEMISLRINSQRSGKDYVDLWHFSFTQSDTTMILCDARVPSTCEIPIDSEPVARRMRISDCYKLQNCLGNL